MAWSWNKGSFQGNIDVAKLPAIAPPLKSLSVPCTKCQILTIPGPLCSTCKMEQDEKFKKAQKALEIYEQKKAVMKGPLPNTFMVYMTKWLTVATGNRVSYSHCMAFNDTFHVFKCTCGQNLNVGADLFYNGVDTAKPLVPSELQDWAKIHRHVCNNFHHNNPGALGCSGCGWAKSEHSPKMEETYGGIVTTHMSHAHKMELLMAQNALMAKKLKLQQELEQLENYQESMAPAPVPKELEVLEQPSGRKFRQ